MQGWEFCEFFSKKLILSRCIQMERVSFTLWVQKDVIFPGDAKTSLRLHEDDKIVGGRSECYKYSTTYEHTTTKHCVRMPRDTCYQGPSRLGGKILSSCWCLSDCSHNMYIYYEKRYTLAFLVSFDNIPFKIILFKAYEYATWYSLGMHAYGAFSAIISQFVWLYLK